MKFIHTADWHLGNALHGVNRGQETKSFLCWLKDRIVENGVEALVVSGDIFDTARPSNEAKSQYYRFLASLLDTCCNNVIIIAGNHDSASELDAPKDILEALNIQVIGSIFERKPEEMVRELTNRAGEIIGVAALVPYAREPELRPYVAGKTGEFSATANRALYEAVWQAADKLRAGRPVPVIATGHLYAAGLEGRLEGGAANDLRNSGIRDIVGNLGSVPVSAFPKKFDYVALGHIHYATTVAGNEKVRYSGSPFVLGFDEADSNHHILLVETAAGQMPKVQKIITPQYFKFVRIQGSNEEIINKLKDLSQDAPNDRVKVEIFYNYKIGQNIREILGQYLDSPSFQVVNWRVNRENGAGATAYGEEAVESVDELGSEEIFRRLLLNEYNSVEFSEELEQQFQQYWPLFSKLLDEVENEDGCGESEK